MKQVVVIHGGDVFATYDEYLSSLRNFKIESIDFFKGKRDWKAGLQDELGEKYEVLAPRMPNPTNARYLEWKIWFEKMIPFLNENVILVGNSLGASFIAKYLSEENLPKKILGTFLIAGVYDTDINKPMIEFVVPKLPTLLEQQSGTVFLYHSKDDPFVNFTELAKFQKVLPHATARIFKDRGHFLGQETFPELIADIKGV